MATFQLKVLSCDRLFYEGECEKMIFPVFDGDMEIMAHHEQLTAQVCVGELRFTTPGSGNWQVAVVSSGIVVCEDNEVTVIVYSAERPEEIDAKRARASKAAAEAALKEKLGDIDRKISEDSLTRAVQRLRSANR